METFDIVIKNGMILTMNPEDSIIENGLIGISGDTISFIGTGYKDPVEVSEVIDAKGGLVLPGLINGHTHAAMTLFRGLADDLPLMDWLNNYIFPVESKMDGQFVHAGTLLACAEMIMSGTTTFCDMYLFAEETASAAKTAGMRCIAGEVLFDFNSPNYGPVEKGLEYTEALIKKWRDDPLISIAVEPHAPYTCSPELLTASNDLAEKYDVPLVVHLSETKNELLEIQKRYNKRPVEHLRSLNILGPNLIADHCVHMNTEEIRVLSNYGVSVIHNPESNMKLASGIAPVPAMLKKGVQMGLGTDGCASNNNLDLFGEMDMAAKLHKVNCADTTVMDALTVLKMATIDGAKALGIGDKVGSLETGKKADIIILDINKPHLTPMYNPYSHIAYTARGADVNHSIINGKIIMHERKLMTLNLELILEKAREKSGLVLKWLPSSTK